MNEQQKLIMKHAIDYHAIDAIRGVWYTTFAIEFSKDKSDPARASKLADHAALAASDEIIGHSK